MKLSQLSIIILAAGLGKRMDNPTLPKVLAKANSKPLLYYVLKIATALTPQNICIVVGHRKELVIEFVQQEFPNQNIEFAEQQQPLGTGDAVNSTKTFFVDKQSPILILSGDVPLLSADTLLKFANLHFSEQSDISVLSAIASNSMGYGRIVRDANNRFLSIVEEKDANEQEKKIAEINSSVYLVASDLLFSLLEQVDNNNQQGEFYLTDIIAIAASQKKKVSAYNIATFEEIQGVNTPEQLNSLNFGMTNSK